MPLFMPHGANIPWPVPTKHTVPALKLTVTSCMKVPLNATVAAALLRIMEAVSRTTGLFAASITHARQLRQQQHGVVAHQATEAQRHARDDIGHPTNQLKRHCVTFCAIPVMACAPGMFAAVATNPPPARAVCPAHTEACVVVVLAQRAHVATLPRQMPAMARCVRSICTGSVQDSSAVNKRCELHVK
mmetsp:Transcript_112828/g.224459  ORF Transcript_112828/g.224459 Transcript_112828/m.224459 type:complete len:188 (+) Transcript_112828:594-1157(+)